MSKTVYTMFARYNQAADKAILGLLNKLSCDEREKDRGSFYKSLSGLARHIAGGTQFFAKVFSEALGTAPAGKPLAVITALPFPAEGPLNEAQWKEFAANLEKIDAALLTFSEGLKEQDLKMPVRWFSGNPPTLPLSSMLFELAAHNTHHRGQISQILDELKIENDYSGINPDYTP